jgi:HK97 family phage prohead protease
MSPTVHYTRRRLAHADAPARLADLGLDAFEGYASLFGVRDGAGDVVAPGAFAASLRRRPAAKVRMLYQHLAHEPLGVWDEIREDSRGLYVRGRLVLDVVRAREVRALIAEGALDGLSIGFRTVRAARGAGGLRTLQEIELWEISVVTFPLLAGSTVTGVGEKSAALTMRNAARAMRSNFSTSPQGGGEVQQEKTHGTGNQDRRQQPRDQGGVRRIPARLRGVQRRQ